MWILIARNEDGMTKFKAGDDVVYHVKGKPSYYATIIEVKEFGNQMWVRWQNQAYVKQQLIDCDNFELVNGRRDES